MKNLKYVVFALSICSASSALAGYNDAVMISSSLNTMGNCESVQQGSIKNAIYGQAVKLELTYSIGQARTELQEINGVSDILHVETNGVRALAGISQNQEFQTYTRTLIFSTTQNSSALANCNSARTTLLNLLHN